MDSNPITGLDRPWGCDWKDYITGKFQWYNREPNPQPSGLYHSASTNCATAAAWGGTYFNVQICCSYFVHGQVWHWKILRSAHIEHLLALYWYQSKQRFFSVYSIKRFYHRDREFTARYELKLEMQLTLILFFNLLKTKLICFVQGLSAYRAVNTLHFGYKNRSLNVL
jgi:hypothetical protein